MSSYWKIFVEEVLPDEFGIICPADKVNDMAEALYSHARMEGEATGQYVFSDNLRASQERESQKLKDELRIEREKVTCRSCNGTGRITTYGGTFMSRSPCYECQGDGRVHPSKASLRTLGVSR